MNAVKEKLKKKEVALGGWLLSGSPVIAEVMAPHFDWLAIDREHGGMCLPDVEQCIRAIERVTVPFVRIGTTYNIGRFLDMGARGIIVPNIRTAEEAQTSVALTRFAPEGRRSYALSRCTGYGARATEYFLEANKDIVVVLMIENMEAVANIEYILKAKPDAVLIGPYDLSGSLGHAGIFTTHKYREAFYRICNACKAAKIPYGVHDPHATRLDIKTHERTGMTFIGAGMDTTTLAMECKAMTQSIRKKGKKCPKKKDR